MSTDAAPADPLRVLVADDSRDTADAAALLIRLWGHECRTAYGGAEALRLAEEFRPDLVLADLAMPGMDGLELARRLRDAVSGTPTLVAVTGLVDAGHRRAAADAGFDLFLAKPPDPEALQRLLEQARLTVRACRRTAELASRTEHLQEQSEAMLRELRDELRRPGVAN